MQLHTLLKYVGREVGILLNSYSESTKEYIPVRLIFVSWVAAKQ